MKYSVFLDLREHQFVPVGGPAGTLSLDEAQAMASKMNPKFQKFKRCTDNHKHWFDSYGWTVGYNGAQGHKEFEAQTQSVSKMLCVSDAKKLAEVCNK